MAGSLSRPAQDIITQLMQSTEGLRTSVRSGKTKQVQSQAIRGKAKALVLEYFDSARPGLVGALGEPTVTALDNAMHDLLDLAQKSPLRSVYTRVLKALRTELIAVEKACITCSIEGPTGTLGPREEAIFQTLQEVLPSAALSYRQACDDIVQSERLSYRGTATELREALRETLDHLAPDKDVTEQPNFKLETDQRQPTMKQKVRFVLRSRGTAKSQADTSEAAVQVVQDSVGALARSVYTRSSVSTHTPTTRDEVRRVKECVDLVLRELLELP